MSVGDPFKDLKQTIEEGKERWGRIEELAEKVKRGEAVEQLTNMADLLVLLVEHLRPLYSAQAQTLDFDAVLKKLLKK